MDRLVLLDLVLGGGQIGSLTVERGQGLISRCLRNTQAAKALVSVIGTLMPAE